MTTSNRVSALPALTQAAGEDLLYIVDDPTGSPTSKKITTKNFLESNVQANVAFAGPLKATFIGASVNSTPANATNVPAGAQVGSWWMDGSYIYVVTGASAIKRVAISTW